MTPENPKPRLWPRAAIGPQGQRAMVHCVGDVPHGWKLEEPLPPVEPKPFHPLDHDQDGHKGGSLPKRKPGRPRKTEVE